MESIDKDSKNLVLTQQAGIVITAVATLALAVLKIRSTVQSNTSTDTTES